MTEREKIEGRIAAAHVNGGASAVTARGDDRYTVTGRAGDRYTVRVSTIDVMECDCKAGQNGAVCWHAAATFLLLVSQRSAAA